MPEALPVLPLRESVPFPEALPPASNGGGTIAPPLGAGRAGSTGRATT